MSSPVYRNARGKPLQSFTAGSGPLTSARAAVFRKKSLAPKTNCTTDIQRRKERIFFYYYLLYQSDIDRRNPGTGRLRCREVTAMMARRETLSPRPTPLGPLRPGRCAINGSVATRRTFSAQGRGTLRVRVAAGLARVKVAVDLNLGVTSGEVDDGSWPYARFKALPGRSSMLM
jgi:hypothetical protein